MEAKEVAVLDHFVVEAGSTTVGVAVRVAGGFRFFYSDPRFRVIDGQVFRRTKTLQCKVRQLATGVRPRSH